jgi:large subunit ribosomal protein L22
MENVKKTAFAISKNIRIAPSKIDKVICLIRGKTYKEALKILKYLPQKSSSIIWQTLYSAVANGTNNLDFEKDKIIILEAFVNQGSIAKRVACGSKGSPRKIQKRSSHITIRIAEEGKLD